MIRMLPLLLVAACVFAACSSEEPIEITPVGKNPEPKGKSEVVVPPVVPNETEAAKPPEKAEGETAPAKKPAAAKPALTPREQHLAALESEDNGVRFAAAVELGKAGDEGCIEALVHCLKNDEDTFVRRAAARSLGQLGSEKAVPGLIAAVGDAEVFVQITAKKALTDITGQSFDTASEWLAWWDAKQRR